jgi:glucose-1-phosphate cytidylyltransferase
MVEIGGRPILWHIMSHYASYGYKDFVICLGYKGYAIKKYMTDYATLASDLTINLQTGQFIQEKAQTVDWTVELVETGLHTQTAGRLQRVRHKLGNQPFMLTYGDGVSNIDIRKLVQYHQTHGKMVTLSAVRPPARFGHLQFEGDQILMFREKAQLDEGWINGGFFVMEPQFLDYISSEEQKLEEEPLERVASAGQLMAYRHESFWQCMDSLRDKQYLEKLWESGDAPWKSWEQHDYNWQHQTHSSTR